MMSFEEALDAALESAPRLDAARLPLADATGLLLAKDAPSDTDLPPFDRAAMDGYAVRGGDLADAGRELALVGEVSAGEAPSVKVGPGECVRIFTGAPVPEGADTVVMQEKTQAGSADGAEDAKDAKGKVRFLQAAKPGANVARRGEDVRAGDVVLRAGVSVRAAEVSLLAAAGVGEVSVFPRPSVSVLSTGNELVAAGEPIRPGQIRDANGPALVARLVSAGFDSARFVGVARDDEDDTRAKIARGLDSHCLIVTGGVSVGVRDLVPDALAELGVEFRFTSVAMKPGRPQKFGLRESASGTTVVFGLPGNPVSVLVATELLVLPVLRKMAGDPDPRPHSRWGTLAGCAKDKRGRRSFAPAVVREGPEGAVVEPVEYHGSGDIAAYSRANAIFTLPPDSTGEVAGASVEFYPRES